MRAIYSPLTLILLAATLFLLPACKKVQKNDQTYQEVESYLKSGSWHVSKFLDSGNDESARFEGYTFHFNNDGYVVASDGNYSSTGTWKLSPSATGNPDDLTLTTVFHSGVYFEKLTKDWSFVSHSSMKCEMKEKSNDSVHIDYLTLEK